MNPELRQLIENIKKFKGLYPYNDPQEFYKGDQHWADQYKRADVDAGELAFAHRQALYESQEAEREFLFKAIDDLDNVVYEP